MKTVIWPSSADRFLSPSPPPPLLPVPHLFLQAVFQEVVEGGRMDLRPCVRASPKGSRRRTQGLAGR